MQPRGYGEATNHITLEHITLRGGVGLCANGGKACYSLACLAVCYLGHITLEHITLHG